ncbi:MAG: triose-phosphate isomerase [Hyphomicrobiales bacterium]
MRILAGNWKMNLGLAEARALYAAIAGAKDAYPGVTFLVFPPFTALAPLAAERGADGPGLGAQTCHAEAKGAFTGEVAPEQARDAGAAYVLVGHSERRRLFCEGDAIVRQKLLGAWRAGLHPVLCVGETLAERERGETRDVLAKQTRRALEGAPPKAPLLVAYEPVWAIGTGVVASVDEVAEAHAWLAEELASAGRSGTDAPRLLYGGSVDPKNAGPLARIEAVDGFLVGGASLESESFLAIAAALAAPGRAGRGAD